MEKNPNPSAGKSSGFRFWLKRVGLAGFMFFLLKGIGWLVLAGMVGKCAIE